MPSLLDMRLAILHAEAKVCYAQRYSREPLSIDVDSSCTIGQIKDLIAQQINVPVEKQSLSLEGHTLENDHRLGLYDGIKDGSTLWLVVSSHMNGRKYPVFISIVQSGKTQETIDLDIFPHDTVAQVKQAIYERTTIDPKKQRLIFAGKEIQDNRVFSDYGIQRDSTVSLVIRKDP